jgi:hypothetical protein
MLYGGKSKKSGDLLLAHPSPTECLHQARGCERTVQAHG